MGNDVGVKILMVQTHLLAQFYIHFQILNNVRTAVLLEDLKTVRMVFFQVINH